MKHYLIIEPHVDDAFLSLDNHIVWWTGRGDKVTIASYFKDGEEGRIAEAASYAKSVGASSVAYSWSNRHRLLYANADVQLIFPLGIQHPDHKEVAALARKGDWLYLDTPYATKQRNAIETTNRLRNTTLVSFRHPPKSKWKRSVYFRSQSKFFHFNTPEDLARNTEIIVCRDALLNVMESSSNSTL